MKTTYINLKSVYGTETVDEVNSEQFPDRKEYRKEVRSMLTNYRQAGMPVYTSQRCTKEWRTI